jgi:hypothetical protein
MIYFQNYESLTIFGITQIGIDPSQDLWAYNDKINTLEIGRWFKSNSTQDESVRALNEISDSRQLDLWDLCRYSSQWKYKIYQYDANTSPEGGSRANYTADV